jgi:hypothetical protein
MRTHCAARLAVLAVAGVLLWGASAGAGGNVSADFTENKTNFSNTRQNESGKSPGPYGADASPPSSDPPSPAEDEGIDIGSGLATVALVIGLIILIGLGAVIAVILGVAAFLLLTLMMASTSALIGMKRKSAKWGVKLFFIQALALAGFPWGVAAFWAAARILGVATPRWVKIAVGGGLGMLVGALSALFISRALGAIYRRLIRGDEDL